MKVYIWVHKNDIINNKITGHSYTRPYQDRNEEWVQIGITQDEFVRLEDKDYQDTKKSDQEYSQDNWNKGVERLGPNPNSLLK